MSGGLKKWFRISQVVEGVRAAGELNFDFVALILLAGMIAALGLMDNSVVSIIAAMLVSPLMVGRKLRHIYIYVRGWPDKRFNDFDGHNAAQHFFIGRSYNLL